MLVDGEATLLIESQAVGTGLIVLADIHATVAALGHEDRQLPILGPTVDNVVIGIAEEEVTVRVFRAAPRWAPR